MGLLSRLLGKNPDRPSIYYGPADRCVYAIGDVHGRADLLEHLLQKIIEQVAGSDKLAEIIFLGDYVDRGDEAKRVLDVCLAFSTEAVHNTRIANVIFLRGNHEEAMLRFLAHPVEGSNWLSYGGLATVASYRVDGPINPVTADDFVLLADGLRDALPPTHTDFLQDLRQHHIAGDYFFVHASVDPRLKLEDQETSCFYWGNSDFLTREWVENYRVVHGHTITPKPDVHRFRVGVDTGAYYTGVLTAICIDGANVSFLDTSDAAA